jgi:hypothetical protein
MFSAGTYVIYADIHVTSVTLCVTGFIEQQSRTKVVNKRMRLPVHVCLLGSVLNYSVMAVMHVTFIDKPHSFR